MNHLHSIILVCLAWVLVPRLAQAQELSQEIVADGGFNGWFGRTLAIDGNTLIAGDPERYEEEVLPQCRSGWGAVTVYKKSGTTWAFSQRFKYTRDAGVPDDEHKFGDSVAIKGNIMVATAPREYYVNGTTVVPEAGAFFVYSRPSASAQFSLLARVYAPVPLSGLGNGGSLGWYSGVATNGTYVAIAEHPSRSGDIFIYRIQGGAVSYLTKITPPDPARARKLFITDQNVLVVMPDIAAAAPYAYQLTATPPTSIDTSSLSAMFSNTVPLMAGDGNTVVMVKRNGVPGSYYTFLWAKFSATAVTSTGGWAPPLDYTFLLPSQIPSALAIRENQGFFVAYPPDSNGNGFVTGFKYFNGSYNHAGIVSATGLNGSGLSSSFPSSVAFNGTDLVLGDTSKDHGNAVPGTSCSVDGSIYIYQPMAPSVAGPGSSRKLQSWMHSQLSSDGSAVATNGTYLLTASPYSPDARNNFGHATLFQSVNGVWQQVEKYVDGWNGWGAPAAFSYFGYAVDLSDSLLAIGVMSGINQNTYLHTGAVHFAARVNGKFDGGPNLRNVVAPSTAVEGECFGESVSLAGNILLVGAPGWGVTPGDPKGRGSVYVYEWDLASAPGTWTYSQQLTADPAVAQDFEDYGQKVSGFGSYAIVGIPNRANAGRNGVGAVQIFRRVNGVYQSVGVFNAPSSFAEFAGFGSTVTMGSDYAAAANYAGNVVIYRRNNTSWTQETVLTPGGTSVGFLTVAIESTRLVVGSPIDGRVHRYERSNGAWSRTGTMIGSSTYGFGSAVDLLNGSVVIGNPQDTVGTLQSGTTYVANFNEIQ